MATRAQTAHLKKEFLQHFAEYGNVSTAARLTGCERRRVYDWQEHDDEFVVAYREAELHATERLEEIARERAVGYETEDVTTEVLRYTSGAAVLDSDGQPRMAVTKRVAKREYSPTLLIFLLKARAPEKYRERHDVTTQGLPLATTYRAEDVALV